MMGAVLIYPAAKILFRPKLCTPYCGKRPRGIVENFGGPLHQLLHAIRPACPKKYLRQLGHIANADIRRLFIKSPWKMNSLGKSLFLFNFFIHCIGH